MKTSDRYEIIDHNLSASMVVIRDKELDLKFGVEYNFELKHNKGEREVGINDHTEAILTIEQLGSYENEDGIFVGVSKFNSAKLNELLADKVAEYWKDR